MECCCKSKFWAGVGMGVLFGAVACHLAHTRKARELSGRMCEAMHRAGERAGEMVQAAREKAFETGAKLAEKMAEQAQEFAEKAAAGAK